jgi:xanthine dehydrogenase YagR molybdenum-binding subunit
MTTAHVGQPRNRVDGRAKVTGQARYAAEHEAPGLLHGWVVSSHVARGTILAIDPTAALALPGVRRVLTHDDVPAAVRSSRSYGDDDAPAGTPFRPLHDATIRFSGQPIALVVAETLELAREAAALVRVEYAREEHRTDLARERAAAHEPEHRTPPPKPRGDAARAFAAAAVRIDAEYHVPAEHHNPMECHAATVVHGDDDSLTVYDKTQGVLNVHEYLRKVFRLPRGGLRVVSPFVGGAFGSGLRPQYHVFLAVLAARELRRSVRVSLTRQQMFTFGHRPETWQRVKLGAAPDGRLEAVVHEAVAETSRFEDYSETVVNWSGLLYRCDHVAFDHKLARLDVYTPLDMRAPGAAWGVYALECAMDELAVALRLDPVELRLRNHAERDQNEDAPFSSKALRECYRQGAERFGWARRDPEPRSMRDGRALLGWGMATGVWETSQGEASAHAVLAADGTLTVGSATADIGTGTYTIMTQIAAETLGLPLEAVTFELGDSSLPKSPLEGGSWTAATVGSAVQAVCQKIRRRLFDLARRQSGSPLAGARPNDLALADGHVVAAHDGGRRIAFGDLLREAGVATIDEKATTKPSKRQEGYAMYAHSAVFAEVRVDEDLGTIAVSRVVSAVAGGRVINPKTAGSQIAGGIVWGIGMALQEKSVMDHAFGRFMTHNLADYHVPVHADVGGVEVIFVDERDDVVNPLGAKGLGEIGLVGVAAAIANAVHHATGRRVRHLPITLDALL